MAKKTQVEHKEFLRTKQASDYTGIDPRLLPHFRLLGLVSSIQEPNGLIAYSTISLDLAKMLFSLAQKHNWQNYETLAWMNDLLFACEVGRALIQSDTPPPVSPYEQVEPWINGRFAKIVAGSIVHRFGEQEHHYYQQVADYLRAIYAYFWKQPEVIIGTSVFPLITMLEDVGYPVIGHEDSVARDSWPLFSGLLFTFRHSAMAGSNQLRQIVNAAHEQLETIRTNLPKISEAEIKHIGKEKHVAVDRLYVSKATEIHTPVEDWETDNTIIRTYKRTVAVEIQVPHGPSKLPDEAFIENLIDLVRPFLGPFGARVIHQLYTIANDGPNWRTPYISIDTNLLLDGLGLKRDERGYHRSKNRERLRDTLNAAHALEIVGEYNTTEGKEKVTKVLRRTVLSILSATYDPAERGDMTIFDLVQKGLPKTVNIRLNFYDGVRQPNGKLGNNFVLMPRLAQELAPANYAATYELLFSYLMLRARQVRSTTISITRSTALEKSNIKVKHVTRATQILEKALNHLIEKELIESFSAIPTKPNESFTVLLRSIPE